MSRLNTSCRTTTTALLALSLAACGAQVERSESDATSQAFTTRCATSGDVVHGLDVSKWQGDVDWPAVRGDGNDFAIARTTHGTGIIDEYFEQNWREIRDAGLIRGTYQYYEPGQDPIAQADIMLNMIDAAGGLLPEDLPPVLDLETAGGLSASAVVASALVWLEYVEQQTQKRPMIYSAASFGDTLGNSLSGYPLWVANYKSTYAGNCPKVPDGWSAWRIWQYSDSGTSSGTNTNTVDLNIFDGNLADLRNFVAASNLGPPGTGGADGAGGSGATGGIGGGGGSGAAAGSGGLGGGGTGAVGGSAGNAGAGGSGAQPSGSGGSGAAPMGTGGSGATSSGPAGCTFAPDCGSCGTCMDMCLCDTGDWPSCVSICASGATVTEPDPTTPAGNLGADDGGCACSLPGRESNTNGLPLLAAIAVLWWRRRQSTPESR